jgi:hypothetical protein
LYGGPNRSKNAIKLFANLMVPESNDGNPLPGQKLPSRPVALFARRIRMARSIQFDGKFQRRTIEIQDVRIDWMLPPEFVTGEVAISKVTTEDTFTRRRVFAEIRGATHRGDCLILRELPFTARKKIVHPSPQSSPRKRGEADSNRVWQLKLVGRRLPCFVYRFAKKAKFGWDASLYPPRPFSKGED